MQEITFDLLPKAVSQLIDDVNEIKRLFLINNSEKENESDRWFDLAELVAYDPEKRTKPTFYGYISTGAIPYHKRGKKLIFLKSEIDSWLKKGRKRTLEEIANDADKLINLKK
jgi:hypothetical protein